MGLEEIVFGLWNGFGIPALPFTLLQTSEANPFGHHSQTSIALCIGTGRNFLSFFAAEFLGGRVWDEDETETWKNFQACRVHSFAHFHSLLVVTSETACWYVREGVLLDVSMEVSCRVLDVPNLRGLLVLQMWGIYSIYTWSVLQAESFMPPWSAVNANQAGGFSSLEAM